MSAPTQSEGSEIPGFEASSIPDVDMPSQSARAITFWSDSGGAGKTTMVAHTADWLGRAGYDVLCFDLDSGPAGLTSHVGLEKARKSDRFDLVDTVMSDKTFNDIIVPKKKSGLSFDIIPSHESLTDFSDTITANYPGSKLRAIRKGLTEADLPSKYDVLLFDAQGSRDKIVSNSIVASRNVIVPTELSAKGSDGVRGLHRFMKQREAELNSERKSYGVDEVELKIVGVIPNEVSHGTGNFSSLETVEKTAVRNLVTSPWPVTPFYIPESNLIKNAWQEKMPLFEYLEKHKPRLKDRHKDVINHFTNIGRIVLQGDFSGIDGPYTKEKLEQQGHLERGDN